MVASRAAILTALLLAISIAHDWNLWGSSRDQEENRICQQEGRSNEGDDRSTSETTVGKFNSSTTDISSRQHHGSYRIHNGLAHAIAWLRCLIRT